MEAYREAFFQGAWEGAGRALPSPSRALVSPRPRPKRAGRCASLYIMTNFIVFTSIPYSFSPPSPFPYLSPSLSLFHSIFTSLPLLSRSHCSSPLPAILAPAGSRPGASAGTKAQQEARRTNPQSNPSSSRKKPMQANHCVRGSCIVTARASSNAHTPSRSSKHTRRAAQVSFPALHAEIEGGKKEDLLASLEAESIGTRLMALAALDKLAAADAG